MKYQFSTTDPELPWSGAAVPIVGPLKMPMDALAEALDHLKWRLADLHALIGKTYLAAAEQVAERKGVPYKGAPSNMTGSEEVLTSQLTVFGTLRAAGYKITWEQARQMPMSSFRAVADDADDAALLDSYADGEDADDADPQVPQTGSAPGVAAAVATSTPETPGLQ